MYMYKMYILLPSDKHWINMMMKLIYNTYLILMYYRLYYNVYKKLRKILYKKKNVNDCE